MPRLTRVNFRRISKYRQSPGLVSNPRSPEYKEVLTERFRNFSNDALSVNKVNDGTGTYIVDWPIAAMGAGRKRGEASWTYGPTPWIFLKSQN
jgi:hypothetical protein